MPRVRAHSAQQARREPVRLRRVAGPAARHCRRGTEFRERAALADGRILIARGHTKAATPIRVEIFDPTTERFDPVPSAWLMRVGQVPPLGGLDAGAWRWWARRATTRLPDGRLRVIDGTDAAGAWASSALICA